MKKLLEYIIENITGNKKSKITEKENDGRIDLTIKADADIIGIIIGKSGHTIKAIRKLLSVRGTLEKKSVSVSVEEK
jgi:predicted RNA-binding protein YlqC (UPF0109 family)